MKQDKKTNNKSGCTAVLAAAMIAAGGFSAYAGNQIGRASCRERV